MRGRTSARWAIFIACFLAALMPSAARAEGRNCATLLVASSVDASGISIATPVELGCFATYAEALSAGSSGAIDVGATTTPDALTDAILASSTQALPLSSVLIGTEWAGLNYGGNSNSYFASSTCSAGVTWQIADVGSAWDNTFSSGKGFGGCDTNKKFQNVNFGGSVLTCTPNCPNYGALSNQVSSLRWKP